MFYPLPDDFFIQLKNKYDEAVANNFLNFNGDSVKNESLKVTLGDDSNSVTIDLQYSTIHSLMLRPEKGDFKKNPFEDPEPELTIIEDFGAQNQFRIVYNKFPVVPRHIMLLTKEFKSQTTPLSPDELIGTFSILKKLSEDKENQWFGFYNCGEASGASQPHKHVQFMTLPKDFTPFPLLAVENSDSFIPTTKREPLQLPELPMAHFIAKLPPKLDDLDEESLVLYFSSLLQRALTVLRENDAKSISYNVIMTTSFMMVVPRSHGKYEDLGINSCGILGLFLFKSDDLLARVKESTPQKVWQDVGFPNTFGQPSDEYHY
ncbi:bifunctional AP-4-A phosphorylase/ADP sulfurylase [Yamadazyma tenuis]|uniref:ATP adenylyltransferase n=1 Tax=Candida tenuis (strain ATCC 10573 / BCRC 21748 / CBS 615 / JCM 9827 / NBRC 10315 / NRRL Y-1498 / VKM Y-70) TaxID=590646 RepID=G3B412_CANTC|nr:ATP adenylyltransferase [Yamadazyma tenuis ATCC 10573]XP_006686608.1 uncharacterized protein CANTEDRAFT_113940 [Yamadazyma tenuis ATCC 10573]EGV64293.1 ATP adenylyltransferase [Yamadazyma tenuis ATCC 10573]EGV64294.1 hypothetical protein CANTEDRAFT_113940 [Yamadazyma tenuis ATCC 10573]WEJ96469.1 bifunctional AP-4-A phosphorylase/ADP sulfurylase [Yamadazyma tenuis]